MHRAASAPGPPIPSRCSATSGPGGLPCAWTAGTGSAVRNGRGSSQYHGAARAARAGTRRRTLARPSRSAREYRPPAAGPPRARLSDSPRTTRARTARRRTERLADGSQEPRRDQHSDGEHRRPTRSRAGQRPGPTRSETAAAASRAPPAGSLDHETCGDGDAPRVPRRTQATMSPLASPTGPAVPGRRQRSSRRVPARTRTAYSSAEPANMHGGDQQPVARVAVKVVPGRAESTRYPRRAEDQREVDEQQQPRDQRRRAHVVDDRARAGCAGGGPLGTPIQPCATRSSTEYSGRNTRSCRSAAPANQTTKLTARAAADDLGERVARRSRTPRDARADAAGSRRSAA